MLAREIKRTESRGMQTMVFNQARALARKICLTKDNRGRAHNQKHPEHNRMKTSTCLSLLAALLLVSGPSATAGELIYSQLSDNQSTFGPSQLWSPTGVNSEVADDFNVVANIDRISAGGFIWGAVDFQGAYVRFYTYGADNKPGALQQEYFLAAGNPNLTFDQYGTIDATLSPAFAATGRHFLSVQPVINYWYWWSSSINAPRGEAFYFRNNAVGEGWHHGDNLNSNTNADVVFDLYGTTTGAGVITSLSESTLPRSGFLQILGTNFGGGGSVLIGGINAPVADWTSTRIVAYVPETAPLTTLQVQVVTTAGSSNTLPLVVTARPASANHVNWRFRMNGPYSFVRPAIGSDGTVYSIDAFSHLYALAPDGGLKWLVRGAGDKGVAVGPDETIYVASEGFIKAYHPDGTEKWTFVQNPRAFICLGVSVGPDGNIYSVGTQGLGVFSLTPSGTLRWTNPEFYDRYIVDYAEIVFGPNGATDQLYFFANNHLRAIRLDGTSVFANSSGLIAQLKPGLQPVVAPDGSVHTVLWSYTPNGNLLWFFQTPYPYNVFTAADIGTDGVHYFVQNLSQLFALNPNGSERWRATVNGYVDGPVVDPLNTQLVMGSQETGDHAGYFVSVGTQTGQELWRSVLPIEDPTVWNPGVGIWGFNQFVNTRGRFAPNGQTAYFITSTATGDNNTSKSFVYSLNTGNGAPLPSPTPSLPISISGSIVYCSNPNANPVPGVVMTLSGSTSTSTSTNDSGNYAFNSVPSGGSYTVMPSKPALTAGAAGINTTDVVAVQRHFLNITALPPDCRLTAADVNGDASINTIDVIAIQRFFLGLSTGTANTGKYSFTPASRSYPSVSANQVNQNYQALVFGDVVSGFVHRPSGSALDLTSVDLPTTGIKIMLPQITVKRALNNLAFPVATTAIAGDNRLVAFQGDLTFDETAVNFASEPVRKAGLTSGNWNVSGNVLPGPGPIRTLRISAYSMDFQPLSGEGPLFELNMSKVEPRTGKLQWAAEPNQFIFIDADLNTQSPSLIGAGSIVSPAERR